MWWMHDLRGIEVFWGFGDFFVNSLLNMLYEGIFCTWPISEKGEALSNTFAFGFSRGNKGLPWGEKVELLHTQKQQLLAFLGYIVAQS